MPLIGCIKFYRFKIFSNFHKNYFPKKSQELHERFIPPILIFVKAQHDIEKALLCFTILIGSNSESEKNISKEEEILFTPKFTSLLNSL